MAKLISVGIHENVNISKETGINEKGKRVIVLEIKPSKKEVRKAMMRGEVLETMKSSFLQFDPNFEKFGQKGVKKPAFEMLQELNKETLRLAKYYELIIGDREKAITALNPEVVYNRLGIVEEDAIDAAMDRMDDEKFMLDCLNTAYEIFHDLIAVIPNAEEIKFRHKFIRGSKKKTFSAVPKYDANNPFVELMSVPREESKIQWTVYELEKGLNSAEEVAADAAEQSPDAANMFDAPIAAPIQPDLVAPIDSAVDDGLVEVTDEPSVVPEMPTDDTEPTISFE